MALPAPRPGRASAAPLALVFLLPAMHRVMGEAIDPQIYSRFFMNNRPTFDHIARAVLADLPEGSNELATVLDLASGPGEPSVTLAQMDTSSKVMRITTTDFQPGMLEKAKARVAAAGVSKDKFAFATASADDLSEYADNRFDAVTMSFGLMFVPDKQKSLREIARVLRPGGRAYLSVWKELPVDTFARSALEEVAGAEKSSSLPPFAINPMALAPESAVESPAEAAGLEIVNSESLTYTFAMGSAKETADGLKILAGSLLEQLETETPDAGKKFDATVEREVQARGWIDAEGEVGIPGNMAQILTLRKPTDPLREDL